MEWQDIDFEFDFAELHILCYQLYWFSSRLMDLGDQLHLCFHLKHARRPSTQHK
jgi:hypothetical protein